MANLPSRQLQLFPSYIDRFLQCPRWYKHQYEDRTKVDGDVRPLLRGIALHEVLAGDRRCIQQGKPFRDDVRELAKRSLPLTKYPDALKPAWKEDIDQVVQGIKWGRERLREIATSGDILAIEETLSYRPRIPGPPVMLRARVDLVVKYDDGTLEIIDYKSGQSARENAIQQLLSLIVVAANFGNHDRVITTTIHTAVQQVSSRELTKTECEPTWKAILASIEGIQGDERIPTPSALCGWCPYFDQCPAQAARGSVDELTSYLEELAGSGEIEHPAA